MQNREEGFRSFDEELHPENREAMRGWLVYLNVLFKSPSGIPQGEG